MIYKTSFIFTIIAGLSTLIGFIPILLNIKDIKKFVTCCLSFSGGVMFSVSLFDLLPESIISFSTKYPLMVCFILFILLFFIGFLLSKTINKRINTNNSLYRIGIVSMMAIIMHNIPEGILTFMATNINVKLGLSLTIMITMHNIPEGIAIAVPIYYSTNNKLKAFIYVLISALSETLGALISFIFFRQFVNSIFVGTMLSIVCGIMSYISIFELLKESKKYFYFIIGIIFMFIVIKI